MNRNLSSTSEQHLRISLFSKVSDSKELKNRQKRHLCLPVIICKYLGPCNRSTPRVATTA